MGIPMVEEKKDNIEKKKLALEKKVKEFLEMEKLEDEIDDQIQALEKKTLKIEEKRKKLSDLINSGNDIDKDQIEDSDELKLQDVEKQILIGEEIEKNMLKNREREARAFASDITLLTFFIFILFIPLPGRNKLRKMGTI